MTAHHGFLARWSRLKRQGDAAPLAASAAPPAPPAPLPALDSLNFEADFTGFLRQEVEEAVRRVALKKLFHSGPFNVMDGLDTYIDDYSIPDPIDEETLRSLVQARGLLFEAGPAPDGDAAAAAAVAPDVLAGPSGAASHDMPAAWGASDVRTAGPASAGQAVDGGLKPALQPAQQGKGDDDVVAAGPAADAVPITAPTMAPTTAPTTAPRAGDDHVLA